MKTGTPVISPLEYMTVLQMLRYNQTLHISTSWCNVCKSSFSFFLLQNLQRFLKSQSQEPQPPWTWAGHRQSGVWTSTLSTCTETASRWKTAVIWQVQLSGHSFLTWYQEWFTGWRWSPTVETWWTKTQCTMQPVSYIMNYKPVHLYSMVCVYVLQVFWP